jgi:uncharacterized phage protein gp47/JayE
MATVIDATGFTRDRLDVILANVDAAMKTIYGQDYDTTPSSPDGQYDGITAEAIDTVSQLAEAVFVARSPAGAQRAALSRLVQINGITRNGASYSTDDVILTGTPGTFIPAGSLVDNTDADPAHFQTLADVTIDASGATPGAVRATTTGPVFAGAGTITAIKTVISGWTGCTNALGVNLGSNIETDAALRIRRAASVALTGKSVVDSLYAALANIQGVSDAAVFENKTGSPIARPGSTDLPPNSIQAVVRGGLDADIAAAIWAKASGGVTLVGAVTASIIDAQGNGQPIKFDRPIALGVCYYVRLKQKYAGQAVSSALGPAIRNALADYGEDNSRTGQSVQLAPLYGVVLAAVNAIGDAPAVQSIYLGYVYNIIQQEDLAIPFNKYPTWERAFGTIATGGQSRIAVADFTTNISTEI